jgi:hypothetical protein
MPLRPRNRKKPGLRENDGNAQFSLCCTSTKMPVPKIFGAGISFSQQRGRPALINSVAAVYDRRWWIGPNPFGGDVNQLAPTPAILASRSPRRRLRKNHSGERTRLACWPTRPRVGELLPLAFPSTLSHQLSTFFRGHSSVGRAPALQAGSQGFESPCLQSPKGVEAKSNKKGSIAGCTSGSVIPLSPVYARSVVESVDCRAVALAEADIFHLATSTRRATTRQANLEHGQVFLRLHPSK